MFGKRRDIDDTDLLDASALDGFFGDEAAAANAVEVHELQHRVERVESQITLIERERADRISSFTGVARGGSAPDVTARLDALEHSVAQIRKGLDECLQRQKALADTMATMFERMPRNPATAEVAEACVNLAPLNLDALTIDADRSCASLTGPIADLSLEG